MCSTSSAQAALAWLLHSNPHVIPIPGTRQIPYLESNVAATDVRLSVDDIAQLNALFSPQHVRGARYQDAGFVGMETT